MLDIAYVIQNGVTTVNPGRVRRRLSGTAVHFEVATAGKSSHGLRTGRAGPSTVYRQ